MAVNRNLDININIASQSASRNISDVRTNINNLSASSVSLSQNIQNLNLHFSSGLENIRRWQNNFTSLYSAVHTGIGVFGHFIPQAELVRGVMTEVGETFRVATLPAQIFLNRAENLSETVTSLTSLFSDNSTEVQNSSNNFQDLNNNVTSTNQSFNSIIPTVLKLTAHLVAMFATSKVLESSSEFESKMRNVNSIMLESEDKFANTSNQVLKLADSLRVATPQELAGALYQIESSGFAGAKALKILETTAKSSAAGLTSSETAVTGLTAVLNGLGLQAEEVDRVSAVMFKTVQLGVVSFEQVSSGIGKVISTAKQLKIPIEDLGAAISLQTRKGTLPEQSFTNLNSLLISYIAPSEQALKLADKLNLSFGEQAIKTKGLSGALAEMLEKTKGNTQQIFTLLGRQEALDAALKLGTDGAREYAKEIQNISDNSTAVDDALKQNTMSYNASVTALKVVFENFKITFGSAVGEALKPFIEVMTEALSAFNSLDATTKTHIARIVVWSAAFFSLISIYKTLTFSIGSITLATAAWNIASSTLNGSIGALITSASSLLVTLAPYAAVAGVFYGIDKAVKANVDDSHTWLKTLQNILDHINLIGKAQEAYKAYQLNQQDQQEQAKRADTLDKAKQTIKELNKVKEMTTKQLQDYADALQTFADNSTSKQGMLFNINKAKEYRDKAREKLKQEKSLNLFDQASIDKYDELLKENQDKFNEATMNKFSYQKKKIEEETVLSIAKLLKTAKEAGKTQTEIDAEISKLKIISLNKISEVEKDRQKELKQIADKEAKEQKEKADKLKKELQEKKELKDTEIKLEKDSSNIILDIQNKTKLLNASDREKAKLTLQKDLKSLQDNYASIIKSMQDINSKANKVIFSDAEIKAFTDSFNKAKKEFEKKSTIEISKIDFAKADFANIEDIKKKIQNLQYDTNLSDVEKTKKEEEYNKKIIEITKKYLNDKNLLTQNDAERMKSINQEALQNTQIINKAKIDNEIAVKQKIQEIQKESLQNTENAHKETIDNIISLFDSLVPGINKVYSLLESQGKNFVSKGLSGLLGNIFTNYGTEAKLKEDEAGFIGPKRPEDKKSEALAIKQAEKDKKDLMALSAVIGAVQESLNTLKIGLNEVGKAFSGEIDNVDKFIDSQMKIQKSLPAGGGFIAELIDIPRQAKKAREQTEREIEALRSTLSGNKMQKIASDINNIVADTTLNTDIKNLKLVSSIMNNISEIEKQRIEFKKMELSYSKDRQKVIDETYKLEIDEANLILDETERNNKKIEAEYRRNQSQIEYNRELKKLDLELITNRKQYIDEWYKQEKQKIEEDTQNWEERDKKLKLLEREKAEKLVQYENELQRLKMENSTFNQSEAVKAKAKAEQDLQELDKSNEDENLKEQKRIKIKLELNKTLKDLKESYYQDMGNIMSKYYEKELRLIKENHTAEYNLIRDRENKIQENQYKIDNLNYELEKINQEFDKKLLDKNITSVASSQFQQQRKTFLNQNNGVDRNALINTPISEFQRKMASDKESILYEFDQGNIDAQKKAQLLQDLALKENIFWGDISKNLVKGTKQYDEAIKNANDAFRDYKTSVKDIIEAQKQNQIETSGLTEKIRDLNIENSKMSNEVLNANRDITKDINTLSMKFKEASGDWITDINKVRLALQNMGQDALDAANKINQNKNISNNSLTSTSTTKNYSYEDQPGFIGPKRSDEMRQNLDSNNITQILIDITKKLYGSDNYENAFYSKWKYSDLVTLAQREGVKGYQFGGLPSGPTGGYPAILHGKELVLNQGQGDNLAKIFNLANSRGNYSPSNNYAPTIYINGTNLNENQLTRAILNVFSNIEKAKSNSYTY